MIKFISPNYSTWGNGVIYRGALLIDIVWLVMQICQRYLITHKAVSEISILEQTTHSLEAFPPSLSLLDKWKFVHLMTVDPECNKTL